MSRYSDRFKAAWKDVEKAEAAWEAAKDAGQDTRAAQQQAEHAKTNVFRAAAGLGPK